MKMANECWHSTREKATYNSIFHTIRKRGTKDEHVKGIWGSPIPKISDVESNLGINGSGHSIRSYTMRIEDICSRVEQLTRSVPLWGLLCSTIAATIWHIWQKRNHRWHHAQMMINDKVEEDIVPFLKFTYRETKYKAARQHKVIHTILSGGHLWSKDPKRWNSYS